MLCGIPGAGADLTPALVPRARARRRLHQRDRDASATATGTTFDMAIELASGLPMLDDIVGATLPARALARGDRSRARRRQARHVQGGVRAAKRPNEETDDRCPDPDSCSRSTSGRRRCWCTRARVPPAEVPARARAWSTRRTRCPGIKDVNGAIRHALLNPIDAEPLPELLTPGMKLTIAIDDISLPLPPMKHARHPPADHRARDRARGAQGRRGRQARSSRTRCTAG